MPNDIIIAIERMAGMTLTLIGLTCDIAKGDLHRAKLVVKHKGLIEVFKSGHMRILVYDPENMIEIVDELVAELGRQEDMEITQTCEFSVFRKVCQFDTGITGIDLHELHNKMKQDDLMELYGYMCIYDRMRTGMLIKFEHGYAMIYKNGHVILDIHGCNPDEHYRQINQYLHDYYVRKNVNEITFL